MGDGSAPLAEVAFLDHASSLEHDTGIHPECPERISAIVGELERAGWPGLRRVAAPAAERAALEAVHPAAHVDAIAGLCARGGGRIDLDTTVSRGSLQAALHAAGGATHMVDLLLGGGPEAPRAAFCALRPPGHHAERARAMGFCLFNNVAVAARRARDAHGVERVLVFDWDVHHGNGTSEVFWAEAAVMYVSIHQSPLYPGTGSVRETGAGAGEGMTVNLPVAAGAGDAAWVSLVEHVVAPLTRCYDPGLVLVSAGYDAHRDDPLANCEVSDDGFAAMAAAMRRACEDLGVALGAVLEGGYDLQALARGVAATLGTLTTAQAPAASGCDLDPLAAAALERLAPRWPALSAA